MAWGLLPWLLPDQPCLIWIVDSHGPLTKKQIATKAIGTPRIKQTGAAAAVNSEPHQSELSYSPLNSICYLKLDIPTIDVSF